MTKGIEIIKAKFVGKNANGFTYDFMTDIDVMPGDFVVVHSLYGPAMARVTAVGVSSDYKEDALKWVIARVPKKKIDRAVLKYTVASQYKKTKDAHEKREQEINTIQSTIQRLEGDREILSNRIGVLRVRRNNLMEDSLMDEMG